MEFEDGLEEFLRSSPTVAEHVDFVDKGVTRFRIYPSGRIPQDPAFPYITHQRVSSVDVRSMNGYNQLTTARFQIDVFAETNREAKQLARAIWKLLRDYRGPMGTWFVESSLSEDREYIPEEAVAGSELGVERYRQDFMISYRDS